MPKGRIVKLNNNYGIIATDAYKVNDEWIPFRIERCMLELKDGKEYIKYTDDVDFILTQNQGIRDRNIKEATNVVFVGDEWKYKERRIETNYIKIIKNRLDEYNFYYPEVDDEKFTVWLVNNNFQSRMLDFLSPGIFIPNSVFDVFGVERKRKKNIDEQFKIELLFILERIDVEFRKYLLSWITGIENAYKTYFNKIKTTVEGQDMSAELTSEWVSKKPKIKKLIKRARDKREYRDTSDEFDYLSSNEAVPLIDFMEQLELNELSELVTLFYDAYSVRGTVPIILERMKECIGFISDLCVIRNAAAHGRSILPLFMDPDYNGNWDLEFDNIEGRSNVDKWILYDKLKEKWDNKGLEVNSKQIVNTIYGNPLRRAWVEMNYIYFYIVRHIENATFKIFTLDASWFLSKDSNTQLQLKNVNICNLRLSDMGNTTLGFSASPYDEIEQEAFAIWELFT